MACFQFTQFGEALSCLIIVVSLSVGHKVIWHNTQRRARALRIYHPGSVVDPPIKRTRGHKSDKRCNFAITRVFRSMRTPDSYTRDRMGCMTLEKTGSSRPFLRPCVYIKVRGFPKVRKSAHFFPCFCASFRGARRLPPKLCPTRSPSNPNGFQTFGEWSCSFAQKSPRFSVSS